MSMPLRLVCERHLASRLPPVTYGTPRAFAHAVGFRWMTEVPVQQTHIQAAFPKSRSRNSVWLFAGRQSPQ